jgi:hypothetical protein
VEVVNMMNLTVMQFADFYIASNAKIRVVKSFETVFEGTKDELYIHGAEVLDKTVAMIGADDGIICIICR